MALVSWAHGTSGTTITAHFAGEKRMRRTVIVIGATVAGLVAVLSFHTTPSHLSLGALPGVFLVAELADHFGGDGTTAGQDGAGARAHHPHRRRPGRRARRQRFPRHDDSAC